MKKPMTLGSLFDGIGGFCLAGQYAGIEPVWASEIEPFPMRVTEVQFPSVNQLGDVHAIHGGAVPPVDIIAFGSPCQNLSIAGKRAGLEGEQSSLFFEAIRIITEMRKHTNGQYPRYAVWENVPGALSSNHGNDFRQVLQSLAQIKDQSADVPMPENGKWHGAGEIMGDNYSLAWRIHDASKGWEWHKDGGAYFLSQILQEQAPEKYSLSPKACQGILRRASKRGKELPEVLKQALVRQASMDTTAV